ncbi:hypothetical protein R3P38DRAFT_2805643 [Favolaschia claudopus]|uniref:Uncharacterized protein n=1 Tax=Favolaschia claudopus TaxID=2862362 RepID=A0AAV9ZM00_9AGAR
MTWMENVQIRPKAWYYSQLGTDCLGSTDIYDSVNHCVRSHTEYTRQPQSTDVKVCDNHTAQTLRFGKETADQAIQQGNAREIAGHRVNRRTYSSVQHDSQQYVTKYGTPQSLIVANQPSLTLPNTFGAMFESPIACNEALDQHYKAICVAGKSEGIEALN